MKKHHFIFLLFLIATSFSFGQIHLNYSYNQDIVYVDSTNVRDSPSINGNVIGKIAHNTSLSYCGSLDRVEGKVGLVTDYWQPIIFQGQSGYIWRPNLADGVFKSELDLDVLFMLNFIEKKGLEFKVFRNNHLITTQFFEYKGYKEIGGSTSFGTTFNSNGKEVIAVQLDSIYKLYEWDGTTIKASDIKLQDDSFITGKYFKFEEALINADKVNVRNGPKASATAINALDKMAKVELLKQDPVYDTINENPGCWYAIKQNGKKGYVWSDFIDIPQRYVKSNKVKDESFLYTNNAIYVFNKNEVRCRFPIDFYYYHDMDDEFEMYKNDFVQFGTYGLNSNYQFLGICYSASACGEAGGDDLYLWDGNKMTHFANDFSMGDGGFFEERSYTFPKECGGLKDIVILETTDEYGAFDIVDCTEPASCLFSHARYELRYNGDTLVEVESKDSKLRAFLADTLSVFRLNHTTFADLNNDSFSDAVFVMDEIRDENDDVDVPTKTLIGVAYGNSNGGFSSLVTNENLTLNNYYSVGFTTKNDTLEIRVNYNMDHYSDDPGPPAYSQFTFTHDATYNKLVWYSKVEAEAPDPEDNENRVWNITNSEKFKKNKVSFSNAWESKKSR